MRDFQTIRSYADKILKGIIHSGEAPGSYPFMENWDWYQGVALFGMYRYYLDTKNQEAMDYLLHWFDDHIARGLPGKEINTMCPLLTLAYLYEETEKREYLEICREWAEYAMNCFPRTEEGGFQHITVNNTNYMQLWDDTLYMTVLFLAKVSTILKREDILQETIRQFLVHIKYLSDPTTGLFFHGFNFVGRHHYARACWGRGNSWLTAGIVDYLEMTSISDSVKWFLTSTLEQQAQALAKYQDQEGMWHTLIDDVEGSYQESSATAGISYGLLKAVRKGYLDSSYAACAWRGLDAVISRIDEYGLLQQVSGGTCLLDTLDGYRNIIVRPEPYGQAMALLLLGEAMQWCREDEQ